MKISFHGNYNAKWGHVAKILCEHMTFSCEWYITSICIVNFDQIDLAFSLLAVGVYLCSGTPAELWRLGFSLAISIQWRRACLRKNRKKQQKKQDILGHLTINMPESICDESN